MTDRSEPLPEEAADAAGASPAEPVTRKVLSSTGALVMRSAWERVLSLVATLAVARLIVPSDLGLAALVLSITAVATVIVDAGITFAFMRMERSPTVGHFRAARRVQFTLAIASLALAVGVSAIWTTLGLLLLLDCLQLLTDPLVLQPKVMLQRALRFGGLAMADAAGVLSRSVLSLGIAYVYPSAAALVIGDLVAAVVIAVGIVGVLGPKAPQPEAGGEDVAAWAVFRDGSRFQGFTLIITARDLSASALIGGVVGLRALGLFQFAQRLLSPVLVVFTSLSQLAVPVGVRVLENQQRAQQRVRQGYLLSGLVTATILAAVAAPSRWLVPAVFGAEWKDAVPLIAALALALVINGPACTFGIGLILAANRTRFATAAAAACAVLFVGTLAAMQSFGGLQAISVAWVTSSIVEAAVVVVACKRILGIPLAQVTLWPIPVFLLAYGAGYWAGDVAGGWLVPSLLSASTAGVVSVLLSLPLAGRAVLSLLHAMRRSPASEAAPTTDEPRSQEKPQSTTTPAERSVVSA